jgi:hypothetical protein
MSSRKIHAKDIHWDMGTNIFILITGMGLIGNVLPGGGGGGGGAGDGDGVVALVALVELLRLVALMALEKVMARWL